LDHRSQVNHTQLNEIINHQIRSFPQDRQLN